MATQAKDNVTFVGVQKSYPPGEKLETTYTLSSELQSTARDWVGLFRVGWSSSRDYYTFEWAPATTEKLGTVTFAGRRLPPEDKHFYQFCYVSSDGRVRGASPPFHFTSAASTGGMDDLELVEVSEDSLMILQSKDTSGNATELNDSKVSGLESELVSVKESVTKLEVEKESLASKFEMVEKENVDKSEQVQSLDEKVADLERQLQAKRESENRLMEKLEKERALNHDLTNEEAQVLQQLEGFESSVARYEKENTNLKEEVEMIKKQNQELNALNEKAAKEVSELQQVQIELMSQIGEKNHENEEQAMKIEELNQNIANEAEKFRAEKEQLMQDLSVAQQNIAELLGAKKEGVSLHMQVNEGQPPTLPGDGITVDKSAYEALQQAYEDIEQRYQSLGEENMELRSRLHDMKINFDASQVKNAELVHRIKKCQEEYEAKMFEVHDLQLQLKSTGSRDEEIGLLKTKLNEMEDNQKQMTESWEAATQELATRKEEIKSKCVKIAELEDTLLQVQQQFDDFQDKHDKVVHDKTAKLDEQQAYLDAKVMEMTELHATNSGLVNEKAKLEHTVQQLRGQLDTLKANAHSQDRSCPICNTKFPGRVSQQDFERHVQAHFPR